MSMQTSQTQKPKQRKMSTEATAATIKLLKIISLLALTCVVVAAQNPALKQRHRGPKELCRQKMADGLDEAQQAQNIFEQESQRVRSKSIARSAMADCQNLLQLTQESLKRCYTELSNNDNDTYTWSWRDAAYYKTWASAVQTNTETCLQSLEEAGLDPTSFKFTSVLANSTSLVGDSLAYMASVKITGKPGGRNRRKMNKSRRLFSGAEIEKDVFPYWLPRADRRRLLQDSGGVSAGQVITVAQDGSGNFTTIGAALQAAPNKSSDRTIIYVMAGVYQEYLEISKNMYNIMLIGDGIDATVITGNRSVVDGWTTFNSATVAVVGAGFIARDISFENTAGPAKQQAVALRVNADMAALYRCSIKGYQDSLYTHSLRQFYRECDIYGTVDFIFGNSVVVFQECNLYARLPMSGQQNAYTAQGRTDPNQNTGISIHSCNVTAAPDLAAANSNSTATVATYLGRPWKQYSRTVYMQSFLDSTVNPAGWLAWSGDFALTTLYYGEFNNSGPGSPTDQRVTWPGYHVMNTSDALNFTVGNFIVGDAWLPDYDVPCNAGLL